MKRRQSEKILSRIGRAAIAQYGYDAADYAHGYAAAWYRPLTIRRALRRRRLHNGYPFGVCLACAACYGMTEC